MHLHSVKDLFPIRELAVSLQDIQTDIEVSRLDS